MDELFLWHVKAVQAHRSGYQPKVILHVKICAWKILLLFHYTEKEILLSVCLGKWIYPSTNLSVCLFICHLDILRSYIWDSFKGAFSASVVIDSSMSCLLEQQEVAQVLHSFDPVCILLQLLGSIPLGMLIFEGKALKIGIYRVKA